jgi:hypothetical protein
MKNLRTPHATHPHMFLDSAGTYALRRGGRGASAGMTGHEVLDLIHTKGVPLFGQPPVRQTASAQLIHSAFQSANLRRRPSNPASASDAKATIHQKEIRMLISGPAAAVARPIAKADARLR